MFNRTKTLLRFKSRIYLRLILMLGALPFIAAAGCSGPGQEQQGKTAEDSLLDAERIRDSIAGAKKDSASAVLMEQKRLDSIAKIKADSIKNLKPFIRPTTKYGVPVNNYKPREPQPEYGAAPNYRD